MTGIYCHRTDLPELRAEIRAAEAREEAARLAFVEAQRSAEYLRETLRISLRPLPVERVVPIVGESPA